MKQLLTKSFAETIERAEMDMLESRLNGVSSIPSNPMGVEMKKFGHATAFSVQHIPGPSFNTVKGITDEKEMDGILDFYKRKEIPVQFEITPAHASSRLLRYLTEKGFYQAGFHTTLYMEASTTSVPSDSRISIRKLKKNEFDIFASIYAEGFGMPSFLKNGIARNNEVLYDNENWTFYLASIGDSPAGIGVVFIKDGIANLAAAATLPEMSNNGVHQALINKRIKQAIADDCRLIVGQAKYVSISQNNMEKAGMKIAYTKAIWLEK